jgi:hypothetical protein
MKTCTLIACIMLVSGCVTVSESQKDAREYQEAEQRAEYFAYRKRCRSNGGLLVIHGTHGRVGSDNIPNAGDYRCQRSMSFH